MITAVLFISNNEKLKKSTPFVAAFIVCLDVIVAGPISGFGMNPARTLASAIPAHTYTDIWIYMVCPFVGMLGAAEVFVWYLKRHDKFI
jgi:aquaporin Z